VAYAAHDVGLDAWLVWQMGERNRRRRCGKAAADERRRRKTRPDGMHDEGELPAVMGPD
jgi:hypothetical protein